jgi:methylisocitrate lyase
MSKGKIFKNLVWKSKPLQIIGTINAYSAMVAEKIGVEAIYLSGSGVATGINYNIRIN